MKVKSEREFRKAIFYRAYFPYTTCNHCNNSFTDMNIRTPEGWGMALNNGICESCYESYIDVILGDDQ